MKQLVPSLLGSAAVALSTLPSAAQTPAEFYKGKTITIYVAVGSGAYDLYARLAARHMPKLIPGNPNMIVTNMPGGGGVVAANYVANVAPRDGTALLVPLKPIAMTQLLTPAVVKYDATKFQWIGSMADAPGVLVVWNTSPAKTLDEARRTQLALGSTGAGGETAIFPSVINSVLGTRFKVITGFPGMANIFLAMERGEIHGVSTVLGSIKGLRPEWISQKKISFIANITKVRSKDLPDVPTILELARTPEERQTLEFLTLSNSIGRSITAPPGVPADRIEALRRAFDAAVVTPDYLRETVDKGIDVNPIQGIAVQKDIEKLVNLPPSTIENVKRALQDNTKSDK